MSEPWVGRNVGRKEDGRLLRGRGEFLADIAVPPRTLETAILRSPHAHARIAAIRADAALERPGVSGVLTGVDAREVSDALTVQAPIPQRYFPIATEKVRFVGEPVAVVAAATRRQAEDAVTAIEVDYEPLEPVTSIEGALADSAPALCEELGSNTVIDRVLSYGDVEQAFMDADHVVAGRYIYPKISSTPIETYGVIADWGLDDSVTVWANFQGPFSLHHVMAKALRLAPYQLRVIVPPDIGGGFGIKISIFPYMVLMAVASRYLGVPVRWLEDRTEALLASSTGTDRIETVEAAVSSSGEVLGLRLDIVDNVGAYLRPPEPGSLFRATGNLSSGYATRHLEVRARAVTTNTCPTGPNRGYGVTQHYFALERLMDRVAATVGLDPAELRMRNLVPASQMPYRTPSGGMYDSGDFPRVLDEALRRADYEALRRERDAASAAGRLFGVGVALGIDPTISNMGYMDIVDPAEVRERRPTKSGAGQGAMISIDPGGGITVTLTSCAQGQGHETTTAQIVADVFGLSPDKIRVIGGMDTATRNWTIASGAYSSRFAGTSAVAVHKVAVTVREKLVAIAAHFLEVATEDVEFVAGVACVGGSPQASLSLRRLASLAHWDPAALPQGMSPGLAASDYVTLDAVQAVDADDRVNSSALYGFTADVAAVEVDPLTCAVRIERYVTVHDVGAILNPQIVAGQIYGGAVHGIGAALLEEWAYESDGTPLTGTLGEYLLPSAVEAPRIAIGHVESHSPLTSLGAKGVGESSTETAPAAIANAVADAVGCDVDRLPLTPDRILRLLEDSR